MSLSESHLAQTFRCWFRHIVIQYDPRHEKTCLRASEQIQHKQDCKCRGLNFRCKEGEEFNISVAKTKALITVTAQLICAFVFAYATECRFSFDVAYAVEHTYEPRHAKLCLLHLRKQRRRTAARKPRSCSSPLFSLDRQHNPSTSSIRNFKPLSIFCGCIARFYVGPFRYSRRRVFS